MKVLVIKLTSMGDIIHLFPALTDAVNHIPNIRFDWVVDDSFKEIPLWHTAVDQIIPVALRRWQRAPFALTFQTEWKKTLKKLRSTTYDLIIDAQGLLKSAILTSLAKGMRVGLDWNSARERTASIFYQKKYQVNFKQHAVVRMRELFAKALGYTLPLDTPDYGLHFKNNSELKNDYFIFFHGTTWLNKHWPEDYWRELLLLARAKGFRIYLPWGNASEKERAEKLARDVSNVDVLPKMSLTELAGFLVNARGVVAVDTGLAHLAAALAIPTVSVYGPTDPELTGTKGKNQIQLRADFKCAPCLQRKCNYQGTISVHPACFSTIKPESVWEVFSNLISSEKI